MKLEDVPVDVFSVRVKSTDGIPLGRHFSATSGSVPVALVSPAETPDYFEIGVAGSIVSITPTQTSGARLLNAELGAGRAMLAQLSELAADDSAMLRIAFFVGSILDMGNVDVGIDEYVEQQVNRIAGSRVRDADSWLVDRCTFTDGVHSYFFMSAGPAIEPLLSKLPTSEPATLGSGPSESAGSLAVGSRGESHGSMLDVPRLKLAPTVSNSFCVTGIDLRFVATKTSVPGGGSIYVATGLTRYSRTPDRAIRLARGRLTFHDWTQTGQVRLLAEAQLKALTSSESSYLRKWDAFGEMEGEIFLNRAREIGALEFTHPVPNKNGTVSAQIVAASVAALDALASGQLEELDLVAAVPEYIWNNQMTFAEFTQSLVQREEAAPGNTRRLGEASQRLQVDSYDRESRTLTLRTESLPPVGTLVMSTTGDVAQIRRRERARRLILEGRSANPQLGLIIEDKGEVTALRSPQRIEALSGFVRAKVFSQPPTDKQELAIDVALNTPDIALIQGPPGTGKTTVIAAILERLNELSSQNGTLDPGQVLLTGYQHDAVENMIDRISLNGIPVPKFGRRSGGEEDDLDAFERALEDWCSAVAKRIRDDNPQIAQIEEESGIRDLYRQYLRTPSHKVASTLVSRIAAVDVQILGDRIARRASRLAKRLMGEELLKQDQRRHVLAVQRIRTRPESFKDDGPNRAEDALVDLDGILSPQHTALLELACEGWHGTADPPFLAELAELKRALLGALTTPMDFRVEKHNDDVIDLAETALERIAKRGMSATDKRTAALARLLADLENNPQGMVNAVSQYSYAFAATAQQSVNKQMQRRKGLAVEESNAGLEYEYVVIDEAARVSPRDLMIPMAQGKKIILVGDHRQLPHIIDEEVARLMEAGEEHSSESEWLKRSMFQYLFSERLRTLEERDGITRRVTLDRQFRMHPVLGDFVSRNFYERFDRTEAFGSDLPPDDFAHDLPGTGGRPAMWIDVPISDGASKRLGTSWTRPAEVRAIAHQLGDWLDTPEGRELSFGVISFYKAQADLIRQELGRRLRSDGSNGRRLRIGTVDSFQGMEFDVVFLSVVRTVPKSWTPKDDDRARQARQLFGHLGLYNRLNVAMSRQRRLLVAVGDSALVRNELASEFIPGLVDFHLLALNEAKEGR